jgi:peroxiredoxin
MKKWTVARMANAPKKDMKVRIAVRNPDVENDNPASPAMGKLLIKSMIRKFLLILFVIFLFTAEVTFAQPRQGQPAAEIALPTISGDTLRLSSFKGKIVLLDFWASWCKPCRFANREMAKIYSKFRDKGFEIFSVSLDNETDAWLKAVKDDRIIWNQVISHGGWSAPVALNWGIDAIPTTYLIDKDGILVAMDLEGKQLEKTLKYMLGK